MDEVDTPLLPREIIHMGIQTKEWLELLLEKDSFIRYNYSRPWIQFFEGVVQGFSISVGYKKLIGGYEKVL